ncbi:MULTISPECIES: hypothetical protein [Flavobacterium]|uniref:Uncharacterized protein n=1 Tax=Flavobacterium sedimenticola TaxID=3043286 RepID=A0ABT6XSM8_9FLAO|nr:hypothetical protein [Flavobacterium sedimenticola]MDI9258104.1 hypothetical protein [Flavobacterium sedimenticola]
MILSAVFEHAQRLDTPFLVEYYFLGEKIEDPILFFEMNKTLYDSVFPSPEETLNMVNKYIIYRETHKLVISEYGFHLIHL